MNSGLSSLAPQKSLNAFNSTVWSYLFLGSALAAPAMSIGPLLYPGSQPASPESGVAGLLAVRRIPLIGSSFAGRVPRRVAPATGT